MLNVKALTVTEAILAAAGSSCVVLKLTIQEKCLRHAGRKQSDSRAGNGALKHGNRGSRQHSVTPQATKSAGVTLVKGRSARDCSCPSLKSAHYFLKLSDYSLELFIHLGSNRIECWVGADN